MFDNLNKVGYSTGEGYKRELMRMRFRVAVLAFLVVLFVFTGAFGGPKVPQDHGDSDIPERSDVNDGDGPISVVFSIDSPFFEIVETTAVYGAEQCHSPSKDGSAIVTPKESGESVKSFLGSH